MVVWSGYTFEKLRTISHHGSHVKGITFDPANKYFATASDDRTIKVFRYTAPLPNSTAYDQTNNFMLEKTITDPFSASPLTTYFRRCSWSPDGNHIAAANAVNGPVSTCAIINRGTWDSEINLVGHEAPLEVCSFSPRIFTPDLSGNSQGITVIACGGQDRNLTIWNTLSSKPLVVSEGITVKAISDLCWTPDGEQLFLTSLDGSILMVSFGQGELGYPLPEEMNEKNLERFGAGRKVGIIEGPTGLLLEEKSKDDELKNVQGRMGELMGDGATLSGVPKSIHVNGISNDKTTKSEKGNKAPEKDSAQSLNGSVNGEDVSRSRTPQPPTEDPNTAKIEKLKQRVTVTKDGKKRVTPLLVSSSAGATESSLPSGQVMAAAAQSNRTDAPQNILDLSKPYDGLPKGGIAGLFIGNKRKLAETGAEYDDSIKQRNEASRRQGATSILTNTSDGLITSSRSTAIAMAENRPLVNPSLATSQLRLAIPLMRSHIVRPLNGSRGPDGEDQNGLNAGGDESHVMEVRNATGPSRTGRAQDREPARITVTKRGQTLWQDYLPRPVLLVTGNPRFWAAACDDGSLFVWTPAGRRLFNAFAMEAQVVILDCRGPWLLALTAVGLCHIWNVVTTSSAHPPVSVAPVLDIASAWQGPHLTSGPSIIFARLTSAGRVMVAMSNGDAFTYSPTMYVWQRLSEPWWAVGSQYWNTTDTSTFSKNKRSNTGNANHETNDQVRIENVSAGVIPLLERNTNSQVVLLGRAYHLTRLFKALLSAEGYEGFESAVSVAHLENRLAASLTLGAKDEFKVYLGMYAKRLGAEGARLKIEELLRSLMAGVFEADEEERGRAVTKETRTDDGDLLGSTLVDSSTTYMGGPEDGLCGWKKKTLLKEVVLILGGSAFALALFVLFLVVRSLFSFPLIRPFHSTRGHHTALMN